MKRDRQDTWKGRTMDLIPCEKPDFVDDLDEMDNVTGYRFVGYYDGDGNFFEHDTTTDKWYRLAEST